MRYKRAFFNLVPEMLLILMVGTGIGCEDEGRDHFQMGVPTPSIPTARFREMYPRFKPQARVTVLVHDTDYNVTRLIAGGVP